MEKLGVKKFKVQSRDWNRWQKIFEVHIKDLVGSSRSSTRFMLTQSERRRDFQTQKLTGDTIELSRYNYNRAVKMITILQAACMSQAA